MSLLYWEVQNWTQYSKCDLTNAEEMETTTTLDLLAVLCLTQPCIPLVLFAARVHSWFMLNLVPTQNLDLFSVRLMSSLVATIKYWWLRCNVWFCQKLLVHP